MWRSFLTVRWCRLPDRTSQERNHKGHLLRRQAAWAPCGSSSPSNGQTLPIWIVSPCHPAVPPGRRVAVPSTAVPLPHSFVLFPTGSTCSSGQLHFSFQRVCRNSLSCNTLQWSVTTMDGRFCRPKAELLSFTCLKLKCQIHGSSGLLYGVDYQFSQK